SIPSLDTDFHLDWNFAKVDTKSGMADFGGVPDIGFDNVTLGLGTFLTKFIHPIMDKVNDILNPIRPIRDLLHTRLPGFSDLPDGIIDALGLDAYNHNHDPNNPSGPAGYVSLLDLAQKYLDGSDWGVALKVFHYIDTFSEKFQDPNASNVGLDLGNFEIS